MGVVAISDTVGSLGGDLARALAARRAWRLADRDIITRAAERYGESVGTLAHAIEERPSLRERLSEAQRRYRAYVEATLLELAAEDDVVLVGRGAAVVLAAVPHVLRVRVIAPEGLRVRRVERREGLTGEAAQVWVRAADNERAARLRFLYHVDWREPLGYDLVLNTERVAVGEGVRAVLALLEAPRFRPDALAKSALRDRSLAAQARAALLVDPMTRPFAASVQCEGGLVTVAGATTLRLARDLALAALSRVAGVMGLVDHIAVLPEELPPTDTEAAGELSHGQFRHGEERSWGGYGGDWYTREWSARHPEERRPD